MRQGTPPLMVLLTMGLSACATGTGGKFACPHPVGVTCMSPTAIYRATEARAHLESPSAGRAPADSPRETAGGTAATGELGRSRHGGRGGAGDDRRGELRDPGYRIDADGLLLVDGSERTTPVERAPEASPYRTAAQVMRIWIAPWEDADGDLHVGARVYTEIEGRRWLVAEPHPRGRGAQVMQLVSSPAVLRPDPAPAVPSSPDKPAAPRTAAADGNAAAVGRK